jgi:putative methyltransferase (TIGR04325 family)
LLDADFAPGEKLTMAVVTQIFPNFAAAAAACGSGYNDSDIADVIAYKTTLPVDTRQFAPEQAINSVLAVGIAAAATTDRPLTVLDFGGGCGFHYFRVVAAASASLRWAVIETPTMAIRAEKLSRGRFEVFTDVAAAAATLGHIDLVHASSSIQYVPEPLATVKELAALRPRYFALLRFPWWRGPQTVGVQPSALAGNGIGPMPPNIADRQVMYPITFTNLDEVVAALGNFDVAMATPSPSSNYEVRGQHIPGISLIFRARAGTPS